MAELTDVLTPNTDRVTVKMTAAQVKAWVGRKDHAIARQKPWWEWWDANLKRYAPQGSDNAARWTDDINTGRDFTLVERKKADLFFRRPDVQVLPSPLMVGQEATLQTHEDILNERLGEDGVDAGQLMDELLFDALCPAGMMWSVLGYQGAFQTVTLPGQVDPMTGQPGPPVEADVPVYEEIFWTRLSPKQILIPEEFKSTCYDKAPWLGYRFQLPLRVAKRRWTLPKDFKGDTPSSDLSFSHGEREQSNENVVIGTEIWYQSAVYRDDITHPLHQTKLVLIDGLDQPVEHRDSPHQSFNEFGQLTPDSLIGFPIHGGTLRVLSDAAYVPSDCTISAPLVAELNKFREQMVRQRESNIPLRVCDEESMPPATLRKVLAAPIGGIIPVPHDVFVQPEGPFKELARANYPRENYTSNDYIDNDIARTHAVDATQSGAQDASSVKTATEVQLQQGNANARLDKERSRVLAFYVKGVTKFSTLIQRYLREDKAAEIVGPERAKPWAQWARTLPTRLSLMIQPDSSLRTDTAQRRAESVQLYQFLANDPSVNRLELTKQVLKDFHKDPTRMVSQPQPPPPPKPTVSFSIKGDDLNPAMPQYPNVQAILAEYGVQLPGVAAPLAGTPPPEHPGTVAPVEPLNKHAADQTGAMQGSGEPAPLGPGGSQL